MIGRLGLAVALLVLVVAPVAAADVTVDAGPLRARIDPSPFRLTFVDARGRVVLGGGRLRAGGAPVVRASRLRSVGKSATGTLVTGGGLRLELRVAPMADGVLKLTAAARGGDVRDVETSFGVARRELFTGFGERSNAVDFNGLDVLNYVSDGPFAPHERGVLSALAPPWSTRARDDDTYYPVPWLLSSRGYGVLAANEEASRFDLGRARRGRWSVGVESRTLSLRVFAGPRPADALRRFTALTGRQPASSAAWVYGPWFQTGQPNVIPLEEEARIIRTLREADAPASAMETQMHFLPCGAQRGLEDYERRRTRQAHAAGLAELAYFNPHLCNSYQPVFGEAAAAGLLQRDAASGRPFSYPSFVGGGGGSAGFTVEPLAQFDFTAPGTEAFYERLVREAFDQGKDGWMEDFGEYTPPFVSSADGTPGDRIHNRYPRDYHCTVHRIARRLDRPVTRHQRSGWTGAARCASIVWGGDPATGWGYDGLRSAVTQALTIGMSGVARWGTDIGGYTTLGTEERLTRELLNRWIELGALSAVMRTKRSGIAIPTYERPQVFDRESLPIWRRYTKLHTQLYPYLRAADAVYRSTGLPIMRHGLLTHPGDERAVRAHDQFLFGPDLLAAPVTAPGARERRLYAPAGRWVDWWRSVTFRGSDGAFVQGRPRLLRGGRRHTLPAPEDELPLLVRAGAVLPLLPADVDTLSPYGAGGVVRLSERAGRLTLLAFPRGAWRGRFGERGRLRAREGLRRWTLAIGGGARRTFTLRATLGTLRRPFRPIRITVSGRRLPQSMWSYDARTSVLTARFAASGRATLRVTGLPESAPRVTG
jgi:alpha-glucosidase (family GH31 glycosyl hydrolase)